MGASESESVVEKEKYGLGLKEHELEVGGWRKDWRQRRRRALMGSWHKFLGGNPKQVYSNVRHISLLTCEQTRKYDFFPCMKLQCIHILSPGYNSCCWKTWRKKRKKRKIKKRKNGIGCFSLERILKKERIWLKFSKLWKQLIANNKCKICLLTHMMPGLQDLWTSGRLV